MDIPEEAVEAFRRAKTDAGSFNVGADLRGLRAAAPLIAAAELERIAAVSHETAQSFTEANMVIRRDDYLTFARVLKDRASELHGEDS